ncbi:MAG: TIM barrel protein [Planctomycetota bacterium]|nr:MAG: TIM barrel protein [Planctomycetota bacterium]
MNSSRVSRREVLMGGIGVVAGLAIGGGCASSSMCGAKKKVCHKGFKIGICDWTMGRIAQPEALDVAKRLGADGVQVDFGMADDELPVLRKRSLQKKYVELTKKHGVEIASFGMVALGWAPYKTDPRWEQWLGEGIEVSKEMGVDIILVPFFGERDLSGDAEGRKIVARKLKVLAPKAERAGVVLGLESLMSAEQNMEIIDSVGSPAAQVYYDVGNSKNKGYDIYREIRVLGKHICECHAKDYGNEMFGKGDIDFRRVREAMDEAGYRGWIVFESNKWEPDTPVSAEEELKFKKNIEYLRGIFPARV